MPSVRAKLAADTHLGEARFSGLHFGRPPAATFRNISSEARRPSARQRCARAYLESAKRRRSPGPGPEKRSAGPPEHRTNRRLAQGLGLGRSTSIGVRSTRPPRCLRSTGRGIRTGRRQIRGAVLRQNEPLSPGPPGSRSGIAQALCKVVPAKQLLQFHLAQVPQVTMQFLALNHLNHATYLQSDCHASATQAKRYS